MTLPKRKFLVPIIGIIAISIGTYFAVQFGKGYRPSRDGLSATGLLSANSIPTAAEVYINGKLTTATNDTLNLPPGAYDVTIRKDGYTAWEKHLLIQPELVTQTGASLFKSVPSLSPLTLSGAANLNPSPDGQKIAFSVASASATPKNGLYVLELSGTALSSQKAPRQIARLSQNRSFDNAHLLWSPDSSQILVHFDDPTRGVSNYLLNAATLNDLDILPDVTVRLPLILAEWEEDLAVRETKQFTLLPPELRQIVTHSAINVYFAPSEEKVMYTATESAILALKLVRTPVATSTQPEERELIPGGIYVYDLVEDKNFRIGTADLEAEMPRKHLLALIDNQQSRSGADNSSVTGELLNRTTHNRLQDPSALTTTLQNFRTHYSSLYVNHHQWYPNSNHILIKEDGRIDLIEYDATNRITLYSGPFHDGFVYPWPDGNRLVILTTLNPSSTLPANLYGIDIK
jgi:hypothetical protein